MKQKRLVSMVGALVLTISAVVLITGCPQANGGISTKSIVEFDSTSVKCKKINSSPYTDVTNESQIQEKDELLFEAILSSDKIVENWYINDVKQEHKTNSVMSYRVEVSDIISGNLKVRFTTKNPVKGNIEFDTASIKCKKKNSYPYIDVTSGSQIQEKDKLMFEAILPTGKVVENWYINDVKQEYETNLVMSYRVEASDIVDGKIKIRVVFK
ncbi:hypothetical protein E4O00_06420 [Treponema sp. OMZ 788]|uniref:hypothetical protein n=1 Tax=Treponema sp. OMZ 788 TaxID=2563664 RepID=UPI0020A576D1|nr:hypothetical protein [Treponema sp. OMZ 788]UTC65690.1 hypothetical protein E4O00_06420 [Treponema sp. OMZ 788]